MLQNSTPPLRPIRYRARLGSTRSGNGNAKRTNMTERIADIIQSPHNPLIKRIRSLGNRKTRYAERAFVLEGMRAFSAAVCAEIEPEVVFLADDAAADLFELASP